MRLYTGLPAEFEFGDTTIEQRGVSSWVGNLVGMIGK